MRNYFIGKGATIQIAEKVIEKQIRSTLEKQEAQTRGTYCAFPLQASKSEVFLVSNRQYFTQYSGKMQKL